ncbi:MAG: DUF3179 domain-containing protein [Caldilineae bacterium]|nr:MAG: DUF3179 domain-containing protein [Caldilineae bacterium]
MVHVRTVDGKPTYFGNAGALYMNAMTWWDHRTLSIWSQPLGEAISGVRAGARLEPLPAQVIAWGPWLASHPQTFVMTNDLERMGRRRQAFREGFVIGIVLGDAAKAYPFETVAAAGAVNDQVGGFPVLVWAAGEEYAAYLRRVGDRVLTFRRDGDSLRDQETGSTWDPRLGLATAGPLAGEVLPAAPSHTSYDWAWRDFYPDAPIYGE